MSVRDRTRLTDSSVSSFGWQLAFLCLCFGTRFVVPKPPVRLDDLHLQCYDAFAMHIPDGALSPQTYIPAFGVMGIIWTAVSARVKKTLKDRQIPLLALSSAFCLVVMFFDVVLPGGGTGHAVGAVLVVILLGPSAACVAVTITLLVQALFFMDGGITALGANSFNMAFVMPFTGYGVYWALGGMNGLPQRFRPLAAALAGYVGLNASALCFAIEMGIQPAIAHDAAGRALYAPYPLQVSPRRSGVASGCRPVESRADRSCGGVSAEGGTRAA